LVHGKIIEATITFRGRFLIALINDQIPSTNFQAPNNIQIPIFNNQTSMFGYLNLIIGICLEFGDCNLEFASGYQILLIK